MTAQVNKLPSAFVWRRLHSLMGLWLTLFLMEHLLVNSQAALLLGDSGRGFVRMVNHIHNLPYLQAIEITLLGVPILIHLIWGIKYLFTAQANSYRTDGSKPSLPEYSRNRAYTWQRITSWILVVGLLGHIAKFRFIDYPDALPLSSETYYFVPLKVDNGIYTVADRLNVTLYDQKGIEKERQNISERMDEKVLIEAAEALSKNSKMTWEGPKATSYDVQKAIILAAVQKYQDRIRFVEHLEKYHLAPEKVVAVADNFGTASLLVVKGTFKNPIYVGLYTIFVLAACFHAFNGLWTFLITWGIVLRMSAQKKSVKVAIALMLLVAFLGLASIWGTYWVNLKS